MNLEQSNDAEHSKATPQACDTLVVTAHAQETSSWFERDSVDSRVHEK